MKKRNSRWDDEPRLKNGKPVVIYPCATDLVIFRLLNRYRYLPLDFIVAHTGLSYSYLVHRLDDLARKPNKFLTRPEKQRAQPNANYRFMIYELSTRGETALKDAMLYSKEPRLGDEHMFAHSLMVSEPLVSIELGNPGEMIWWPEIAGRLKEPNRFIPVHIEHLFTGSGKKSADFDYYNDSNGPFGIRYAEGEPRFLSLEAEHTTDVEVNNLTKTSFLKKLLAIRYLMDHKLYVKHWGLPNLVHLVVCQSQARIDTRKELILKLTNGKGLPYIAFAVHPAIEDLTAAKPMPELFTQGWQRAGHPDLFLNSPTAKKAAA